MRHPSDLAPSPRPGVEHWGSLVLPRSAFALPTVVGNRGTLYKHLLAAEREGGVGPAKPLRILMVEDDVALATMYALRLRRDGHGVTVVHDGESGLEHAVGGAYDLVFLDINLPRLDGLTILQRMRELEDVASRPVVILSNYSEPPLITRGEELGARRYLVKSEVTPAEIAAGVWQWSAG